MAGITTNPTDWFMGQAALTARAFLEGCRFLIQDRDTKFSLRFRIVMEDFGITPIKTPLQAPNANAYAERFVLSIKSECLRRMILFGEASLRHAISEYVEHYHTERAHQGIGNERIEQRDAVGDGEVVYDERLGGLLKCYRRAA